MIQGSKCAFLRYLLEGFTTWSIIYGKKAEAMSMVLSEGEIGTFQECVRRDLLTYVSYPSFKGATRCFAYPQFLVDDETLTLLEDSAFPDNGCLPMVTSRTTPHELLDMFGNVVVMRVNDEHPGRNRNYPESENHASTASLTLTSPRVLRRLNSCPFLGIPFQVHWCRCLIFKRSLI